MADIIKRDFGKEDREHARRLAHLLNLLKDSDDDLLADPGKYFEMASKKIADQHDILNLLYAAVTRTAVITDGTPSRVETPIVSIDRRDYEAFQKIKEILRDWRARS